MSHPYYSVAQRLRAEIPLLAQTVVRISQVWDTRQESGEDEALHLESVALNLHSFYTGVEHLLELIASQVDRTPAMGETWHRDLLMQMATELATRRPAVIGPVSYQGLDECRRFRHLVRNIYAVQLQPTRMQPLTQDLARYWPVLQVELLAFADFLEQLAADEGE